MPTVDNWQKNNKMVEMTATITNTQGIHCRPSGVIYKACENYTGEIVLKAGKMKIQLTSIMDIILLGLFRGDSVVIQVSGENEAGMCKQLVELFERNYDFPPREK
ncbi:MAG: HPr family phosphocarrier protein [Spirochaetales bacterium]|nr:HPr family phosphocarrier protein [Spirochaetales bacterium]